VDSVPSLREHHCDTLDNLRQQFGKRLRALRMQRSLTQEKFAELTGISVDFLSLIERGIGAPSFENIELISSRLGVDPKHLFDFSETRGRAE